MTVDGDDAREGGPERGGRVASDGDALRPGAPGGKDRGGPGRESAGEAGDTSPSDLPARSRPAAPVRRFTDDEVARILRSAADLQERSSTLGGGTRGLTLEDLRSVASEVGIDPRFVELAASRVHGPPAREESALAGGPYAWSVHRTIAGTVREEDRDWVLRAVRTVVGNKGQVEDVYGRMEWSYDDGLGPVLVGLASREGITEIDVSVRRSGEIGLLYGLAMPLGGVLAGGALGSAVLGLSGPVLLPVMGAAALAVWGGLRPVWSALARRWEAKVDRLADAVTGAAEEVAVLESGRRDLQPGEAES